MYSLKNFFTKKQWLTVCVGALVLIIIAITVGYKIGKSQQFNKKDFGTQMTRNGQNRSRGPGIMRSENGNVLGSILEQNNDSLTISIPQGGSRTILVTPKTTILKTTSGTKSDLVLKQNVMVTGVNNADGSITANTISIRP